MTPPEGAPWWAWVLVVVATAVASALTTWATNRRTRADVAVIRDQVANTHDSNFRDDVDELGLKVDRVVKGLEQVRQDVGGAHSEIRDARNDIDGVRTDARRDRRRLGRLERLANTALDRAQHVLDEQHPGVQLRDPDSTDT